MEKSELRKVVLSKDYAFRDDIIIETGSVMYVGAYRASQLHTAGFTEVQTSVDIPDHIKKSGRQKKEEPKTIVEHKIAD